MHDRYRADIDGLRALAVLPVILFHANVPGFDGGYVGVDIFFVISGYLITGILYREAEVGQFSIARFYERRVRRIFPALFFMLAGCAVAGVLILLPDELTAMARSSIATALFYSNFQFYSESGYFSDAAESKVLLHTWSLAVEEQFYIFFPPVLWALHRWTRRWVPAILAFGAAGSFLLAAVMIYSATNATFFLLPGRAWELLAGSLLAIVPYKLTRGRTLVALVGVAAIAWSVLTYTDGMLFPGPAAALPVFGSVAIILAADGNMVGRILSTRPIRGVGLISYSLYLWHWPILVFARFLSGGELAVREVSLCLILTFCMAYLSWRYVERPFRRGSLGSASLKPLFAAAGGMVTACVVSALLLSGLPSRLPPRLAAIAAQAEAPSYAVPGCFYMGNRGKQEPRLCLTGTKDRPVVALWGDSHAHQFTPALVATARARGQELRLVARGGCPPLTGISPERAGVLDPRRCRDFNVATLDALAANRDVKTVILSARWARVTFPREDRDHQYLVDDSSGQRGDEEQLLAQGLTRTIERLRKAGKRVIVIGDVPEAMTNLPRCVARAQWLGLPSCPFNPATLRGSRSEMIIRGVIAQWPDVQLIEPNQLLCDSGCPVMLGSNPLLSDRDHLSASAAARVVLLAGFSLRL